MEPRNVSWAHGVNNADALAAALADESCHMIEADLMVRGAARLAKAKGTSRWEAAGASAGSVLARDVIMCHPPDVDSDLSFEQFFKQVFLAVKAGRRVGLKLDFKDADAVLPCLRLMRDSNVGIHDASYVGAHAATRTMPLWLNADVVRGPGGRTPIPGKEFVESCLEHCPSATLSLGWTHSGTPLLGYTKKMIAEMAALAADVPTHVTFAPSAAHLYASAESARNEMLALIEDILLVEKAVPGTTDANDANAAVPPTSDDAPPKNQTPPPSTEFLFETKEAAEPRKRAPRTVTVWGPVTSIVRRWIFSALPANKTYVDVKAGNAVESAVISAHVVSRPAYARLF
jgi:hypothetical protein